MGLRAAFLLAVLTMAGPTGCTTPDRAEAVFLYQNQVTAALAEAVQAAEAEGRDVVEELYDAEAALRRDCGPLQNAGYRRLNQEELDTAQEIAAFDSVAACNATAAEVEVLIRNVDPETASYFLSD